MARSNAYPSSTIQDAFEFTDKIFDGFGKKDFVKTETLAQYFKKSAETLKGPLSSASQYGLLTMKKRSGYVPSALFHQIKYPHSQDEKVNNEIECLKKPPLYNKIISKYNNEKLPIGQGLKSLFIREYGITEAGSERALQIWEANLKYLSLLDDRGILRVSGPLPVVSEDEVEDDNGSESKTVRELSYQDKTTENQNLKRKAIEISVDNAEYRELMSVFLDENRTVYVKIPKDFYEDDLEYFIDVLRINLKRVIKRKE